MNKPIIGVLALQGCVKPHRPHIEALEMQFIEVRTADDLKRVHGLIIPGGESTTMLKLIDVLGLEESLRSTLDRVPAWGICAGAILLASQVKNPDQKSYGAMDIEVERNSYGRQQESFEAEVEGYTVAFIRAPRISSGLRSENFKIRSERNGDPIWIESNGHMATTFHPELSTKTPSPFHRRFADMVQDRSSQLAYKGDS